MTLKLNRDLDVLQMYLQTENEVANPLKIYNLNWESTKIAHKVLFVSYFQGQGQGQMSPIFNHF